jgi:hypothetical protein
MRLHLNLANAIVIGLSNKTQTWPEFAYWMRLGERCATRFSHGPALEWARSMFRAYRLAGRRFGGICFRVCVVAIAINDVASPSARAPTWRVAAGFLRRHQ